MTDIRVAGHSGVDREYEFFCRGGLEVEDLEHVLGMSRLFQRRIEREIRDAKATVTDADVRRYGVWAAFPGGRP